MDDIFLYRFVSSLFIHWLAVITKSVKRNYHMVDLANPRKLIVQCDDTLPSPESLLGFQLLQIPQCDGPF